MDTASARGSLPHCRPGRDLCPDCRTVQVRPLKNSTCRQHSLPSGKSVSATVHLSAGSPPKRTAVLSMDVEDWYHLDYFHRPSCDASCSLLDGLDVYLELLARE